MSIFAIEEWYRDIKCTVYSIRKDIDNAASYTEADHFFEKYGSSADQDIADAAKLILQFVVHEIAKVHGAKSVFFNRIERKAQALPYKAGKQFNNVIAVDHFYSNFPLRLYCYRLTDNIIILYNGGIKTSETAQNSKDLSMKFYEAQHYTSKIEEALMDKTLFIANATLNSEDSSGEIIL